MADDIDHFFDRRRVGGETLAWTDRSLEPVSPAQ